MKKFGFGLALVLTLALAGCGLGQVPIESARDLKILLDSKAVPCEEFQVDALEDFSAQTLTCLDGTADPKAVVFVVWPNSDLRSKDLASFCFDLARKGNAKEEMVAGESWLGYSDSVYLSIPEVAEALDADLVSGLEFCESQNLEVAASLSDQGLSACNSLSSDFRTFESAKPSPLTMLAVGDPSNDFYFGDVGELTNNEWSSLTGRIYNSIRELLSDKSTPDDLLLELESYPNSSTPLSSFRDAHYFKPADTSVLGSVSKQTKADFMNEDRRKHNELIEGFNQRHGELANAIEGILGVCKKYAPVE